MDDSLLIFYDWGFFMSVTVCSRRSDQKSKIIPKYENFHGQVIQAMPVRELNPDVEKLVPVARFIFEKMNGVYLGGFNSRPNTVIVKKKIGSMWEIDVKKMGVEHAENCYKVYGIDKNERASCEWLFSIIEPNVTDEEYFNREAKKISDAADFGGQIVCRRVIPNSGFGLNAKTKLFIYNL